MNPPFDYPASVVEAENSVIFCLDPDLRITYCNPAWDRFAQENGGHELLRPAPIGRSVLDYISAPVRDHYARLYERILNQSDPWEEDFECSSQTLYRRFRSRLIPMKNNSGLLVMNYLHEERQHDAASCAPVEEVYRTPQGVIVMCASCRRTRRANDPVETWDWVPHFVGNTPLMVSHGVCPPCRELYYPGWNS
jgi:hypothetical protein